MRPKREAVQGRSMEEQRQIRLELWCQIRTTNLIERSFKEVKGGSVRWGSLRTPRAWNVLYLVFFITSTWRMAKVTSSFLHRMLDITGVLLLVEI